MPDAFVAWTSTMTLNQPPPDSVEVLVAGAGPAGIAAANALNHAGVDVLMVDAREKAGHPLRCAEMTRREYLDYFGVDAQPGWVRDTPGDLGLFFNRFDDNRRLVGEALYRTNYPWIILDRQKSEYDASRILASRGVHVIESCSVNAVGPWQQNYREVTLRHGGKSHLVKARMIIAADGPSSLVSRYAGIAGALSPTEVISYYVYEMSNITTIDPGRSEIYMFPELNPFYFWVFPHSTSSANVGLGVHGYRGHVAKPLLDEVLRRIPAFQTAAINKHVVAWTPSASPLIPPYGDGIIAVGGAARLTGSISGEGLWSAVVSGKRAGDYYVQHRHQILDANNLGGYMDLVKDLYQSQLLDVKARMDIEGLTRRRPGAG